MKRTISNSSASRQHNLGPESPADARSKPCALDLVRTTEAAALAAARWVGRGEKNAADKAAVDANGSAPSSTQSIWMVSS